VKLSPTVLSLLIAVATAAWPAVFSLAAVPDEPGPDQFMITAERVEAEEGPRGRIVRLEENVTVTHLGATLRGAHGIYYEAEGHVILIGNVTGEDEGRAIACSWTPRSPISGGTPPTRIRPPRPQLTES